MKKFEDKYLINNTREVKNLSPNTTGQSLEVKQHINPKIIDFTYDINKDKKILEDQKVKLS